MPPKGWKKKDQGQTGQMNIEAEEITEERPSDEAPPFPSALNKGKDATQIDQKKQNAPEDDEKEAIVDCSFLPNKDLFRVDEVARYFGVTEQTIRLWVQHGILRAEKPRGPLKISRKAIIDCRFNSRVT